VTTGTARDATTRAAVAVEEEGEATRRRPTRPDLLSRGPLSLVELAAFGILVLILAFAVFGPHLSRGGFTLDDWAFAADSERYGGIFNFAHRLLGDDGLVGVRGRPLQALYFSTTYTVFGATAGLHLALAVLLGAAMSVLLYALLRNLAVEPLHAGAIATLVLVFPAADAPRLWPAAAPAELTIAIFIGGLLLALRGLRSSGRPALLYHAGALALYAASLLTYELTFGAILLTGLVYRLRAPWRRVIPRWGADLVLVAVGLVYVHGVRGSAGIVSTHQQIENAKTFQHEARTLLSSLGITNGQPRLDLKLVALVLLAAVVLVRFLSQRDVARRDLRRWLVVSLAGLLAIGAGYLAVIPSSGRNPLDAGFGNRINIAAAIGYTLLIYAIVALLATMVVRAVAQFRPVPSPRAWAAGLALAGALMVGALWVHRVREDRIAWDQAHSVQERTLAVLRASPRPAPGSTIYTFGVPGGTAPGVVAFGAPFDLVGAVRLLWHDQTLFANPSPSLERGFYGNTGGDWGIDCTRASVRPRAGFAIGGPAPYGKAVFVDVPAARSVVVRSRSQCRSWASRYKLLRQGSG
jgi:hypothetical protein